MHHLHDLRRKSCDNHCAPGPFLASVCISRSVFATPWTVAHQAPLSMGFSRQEYWSRLPSLLQLFDLDAVFIFETIRMFLLKEARLKDPTFWRTTYLKHWRTAGRTNSFWKMQSIPQPIDIFALWSQSTSISTTVNHLELRTFSFGNLFSKCSL